MKKDFSHLIGIPYSDMNCWELARRFYLDVFGVELKHYCKDIPEERTKKRDLIYTNKGDFAEVDYPQFGDIILFSIRGIESHIGIWINPQQFLHSSRGVGSCLDRIDRWKTHITGFYGHTPGISVK